MLLADSAFSTWLIHVSVYTVFRFEHLARILRFENIVVETTNARLLVIARPRM
jgi:hypothetical protein